MDDATRDGDVAAEGGDREIFAIPRIAFLRSVLLNHAYHHRGQLTVYLRMLGRADPVDLRAERRRKSVCVTNRQ